MEYNSAIKNEDIMDFQAKVWKIGIENIVLK